MLHKIYFVLKMLAIAFVAVHLLPNILYSEYGARAFSASYFSVRTLLIWIHLFVMYFQ
jgi:hypothetical protein